jgi:mono/diheme cytochrome c family protein
VRWTVLQVAGLLAFAATACPAAGDPDKGNEVFDEQCAQCHHAYKDEKKAGPSLKWLFSKDKLDTTGKPVNEVNVLEKIDKGGNGMPAFKGSLSSEDRADLLAYLKTL